LIELGRLALATSATVSGHWQAGIVKHVHQQPRRDVIAKLQDRGCGARRCGQVAPSVAAQLPGTADPALPPAVFC
jgi:hypothetical protein